MTPTAELKAKEAQLSSQGIYVEPYGHGFIIADYNQVQARYRGRGREWQQRPASVELFMTKVEAVKVAGEL